MMPKLAYISVAVFMAFGVGFGAARDPVQPFKAKGLRSLQHGGEELRATLARLDPQPLKSDTPPELPAWVTNPAGAPPVTMVAPSAAPDIAAAFRKDITAVAKTPSGFSAWIIDANAERGQRLLKVGDIYRDGWRIAEIGGDKVTLKKKGEAKVVTLSSSAPMTKVVSAASSPSSASRSAPPASPPTSWPKGDPRSTATKRQGGHPRAL